jgi:hypothetical protein
MTTHQLEEAICNQYDNGRYRPTGADGGALRYILVNVDGKQYHASITLDSEIAAIRRIWELSDWTDQNSIKRIYNYKDTYYQVSNA